MELADSPLHGVTLTQYAAVQAALAEEFSLDEILRKERIDAYDFERADAKWKARLTHESSAASGLADAYREALIAAEDHLKRKVSPIDTDAAAWAAFFAAYSNTPDRSRLLGRYKMNPNDIARLQRFWHEQAAKKPDVFARLEHVSTSAPLPTIEVGPRVLARSGPRPVSGETAKTPELAAVPDKPETPAARTLRRVETFGLDRYASFQAEMQVFPKEAARLRDKYDIESEDVQTALINEFRAWIDEDAERMRAYRRLHATALDRARKVAESTTAAEREETRHAAVAAEVVPAGKTPELSLGHEYTPPPNPLPIVEDKRPAVAPAKPAEGATQDVDALLAGAGLPFAKDFAAPEFAAARAEKIANATQGPEAEDTHAGGTQDVASILQKASLPFQASRTNPGSRPETPAPIPEGKPEARAMPAFPDLSLDQYAALCAERDNAPERVQELLARYRIPAEAGTAFFAVWKSRLANDPSLGANYSQAYARYASWFAQRTRPAAPSLTIEQYASLVVDLSMAPGRHTETLARYRLSPEEKAALDKHYQHRFACDPQSRAAFEHATRAYSAWLAQSRPR